MVMSAETGGISIGAELQTGISFQVWAVCSTYLYLLVERHVRVNRKRSIIAWSCHDMLHGSSRHFEAGLESGGARNPYLA